MTSAASDPTLDSSGHPDVETLSEYVEDLLSPQAAAELAAHLDRCPDCRESCDALDEIRSLLGRTEAPPIPDDIALRIDAALAAEAAHSTAKQERDPGELSATPARSTAPTRPAGRGGPQGPTGPGSAGPAGRRPGPGRSRRLRRAALWVSSLAVCGLIVTAVVDLHPDTGSGSASSSAAGSRSTDLRPQTAPHSTVFTASGFTAQIQALVQGAPSQGSHQQALGTGQQPSNGPASATVTTVPSCVLQAVSRPGEQSVSTATGSYQGTPVYALVYPDRNDPAHSVDAYLVDAGCTTRPGSTGQVLLQRTVPRP